MFFITNYLFCYSVCSIHKKSYQYCYQIYIVWQLKIWPLHNTYHSKIHLKSSSFSFIWLLIIIGYWLSRPLDLLMCSLYIWIQILNLTYPNISMLVTMRQASNADRADNIILVEFPRIWGLRNTMIQIMFPTSPINPTVFVMIPWRINENKINLGSSSLFPTYHFGGNNIWK